MKIDANLSWQYHVNDLSVKMNRANALLFKMRKYVSCKILTSIYFAIFDTYLSYCCLVWTQNCSTIQQIVIFKKMAVRIIIYIIFNQGILISVTYSNKGPSWNFMTKFAKKIFYLSANLQIIYHHQFLIYTYILSNLKFYTG